jgi:hypothetical protein
MNDLLSIDIKLPPRLKKRGRPKGRSLVYQGIGAMVVCCLSQSSHIPFEKRVRMPSARIRFGANF